MTTFFVYAATRTPFGRFDGALDEVRPDDLAAAARTGLLSRAPALDPAIIGDGVWGNANGARGQPQRGTDGRAAGRSADVGDGNDRQQVWRGRDLHRPRRALAMVLENAS
jgi:acetyl-CoA acyltransferase